MARKAATIGAMGACLWAAVAAGALYAQPAPPPPAGEDGAAAPVAEQPGDATAASPPQSAPASTTPGPEHAKRATIPAADDKPPEGPAPATQGANAPKRAGDGKLGGNGAPQASAPTTRAAPPKTAPPKAAKGRAGAKEGRRDPAQEDARIIERLEFYMMIEMLKDYGMFNESD